MIIVAFFWGTTFVLVKDINNLVVKINTEQIQAVYLTRHLQYMLGFGETLQTFAEAKTVAQYPPDMRAGFSNMFIYCSIVEPQIVGDSMEPLLRIVPVEGRFGDIVERVYNNPHYVGCLSKSIGSISISIKDDRNQLVPYQFGKVLVNLHFRKKRLLLL